jgi:hypothetical protein
MLDISLLDKRVIGFLEKYSWQKGRKVDVSKWIDQLTKEGYICFPYAVEILEELGGIDVRPERVKIGESFPGDFDFHAFNAGSGELDIMEFYKPIAGENLFPLGMVYGQWFLYVGLSKKIYMGGGDKFYLLGENIEEFLNNIIMGTKKPIALHKEG